MQALHLISGLPRSGSTLLSALLRQNPHCHAHISSPLSALVGATLQTLGARSDFQGVVSDTQRERLLRGLFDSYYAEIDPDVAIFDTNRTWTARIALIALLYPTARIICCVRSLPEILASIEKRLRSSPLQVSRLFAGDSGINAYTRAEALTGPKGLVGGPFAAVREAYFGPFSDRLLIIPYRTLVSAPQQVMDALYAFVDMPSFTHDIENVEFAQPEFDATLGVPDLHTVSGPVRAQREDIFLPPDLAARFDQAPFWLHGNNGASRAQVLLVRPNAEVRQ